MGLSNGKLFEPDTNLSAILGADGWYVKQGSKDQVHYIPCIPDGNVKIRSPNGNTYEGEWKNGGPAGDCRYVTEYGIFTGRIFRDTGVGLFVCTKTWVGSDRLNETYEERCKADSFERYHLRESFNPGDTYAGDWCLSAGPYGLGIRTYRQLGIQCIGCWKGTKLYKDRGSYSMIPGMEVSPKWTEQVLGTAST
jgi:hypothetical protein